MGEKIIPLDGIELIHLYGVNNSNIDLFRKQFPKMKIIDRGNEIKLIGTDDDITLFDLKLTAFIKHLATYGKLSETDVKGIFGDDVTEADKSPKENEDDIILFGKNGLVIKPRSVNQYRMVESAKKNDMIFAVGPAGSGKTYTAVALGVKALKNKEVKRIILTRPAIEAGEKLGYLPGDIKEKLDPYLQPLFDALRDMIPTDKLAGYMEDGTIQIAPLAYMRGRTLDNAFAILDEAQNATETQLKMFLTRMGKNAKFFITGDITQIDLPYSQSSGLIHASRILKDIPGVDFIYMDERDIVRHKIVVKIVEAYSKDHTIKLGKKEEDKISKM